MARRGRCRCGSVLKFQKGPEGYKTRCPSCGSVVRLKPIAARSIAKKRKASRTHDSSSKPAAEMPAIPLPASESGPSAGRTVVCEVCYAMVPAVASHCPDCGAVLDVTVAAPTLDMEHSSTSTAIPKSFSNKLILCGLTAGAVLLIAAILLIIFFRQ